MQATQSATAIREAINRSNGLSAKDEDNVCAAETLCQAHEKTVQHVVIAFLKIIFSRFRQS